MSYSEVHKLPITYRKWFLNRLIRHFETKSSFSSKDNSTPNPSEGLKNLNKFESLIKGKLDNQ